MNKINKNERYSGKTKSFIKKKNLKIHLILDEKGVQNKDIRKNKYNKLILIKVLEKKRIF